MKKVLIADDHSLYNLGITSFLKNYRDFEIVGSVINGQNVMNQLSIHQPDLLILDLNMPKKNGLEILKELKDSRQNVYVVIVTLYNDSELIEEVRKAGGNAYFLKNSNEDELLDVLVNQPEEFYISTSIFSKSTSEEELTEDNFSSIIRLTAREKEILRLIVQGLSSQEIGDKLFISKTTVDTHRRNMFKKLSFKRVSELIHYAHKNNLV